MQDEIVKAIDKAVQYQASLTPGRGHLGASVIGDLCPRKVWYGFRWAHIEQHTGRLLRLFDRGHEEEHRFVRFLRQAGFEVRDYSQRLLYHDGSDSYVCIDWEETDSTALLECDDVSDDPVHIRRAGSRGCGPRQWNFRGDTSIGANPLMSHFSGSADGQVKDNGQGLLPDGWGLLEFKTHSDKSFKDMEKKGVLSSKMGHYVQMQIYMHHLGLKWALYMAVNKNDDSLYVEVVYAKPELAAQYIDRAAKIIGAQVPPARYSNDPSWWQCKFCPFREICYYDKPMRKSCRTCAYAEPTGAAEWKCNRWDNSIPADFQLKGCDNWNEIK